MAMGKQENTDKTCAVGGSRNTCGRPRSRRHKAAGRVGGACSGVVGLHLPAVLFCPAGQRRPGREKRGSGERCEDFLLACEKPLIGDMIITIRRRDNAAEIKENTI